MIGKPQYLSYRGIIAPQNSNFHYQESLHQSSRTNSYFEQIDQNCHQTAIQSGMMNHRIGNTPARLCNGPQNPYYNQSNTYSSFPSEINRQIAPQYQDFNQNMYGHYAGENSYPAHNSYTNQQYSMNESAIDMYQYNQTPSHEH